MKLGSVRSLAKLFISESENQEVIVRERRASTVTRQSPTKDTLTGPSTPSSLSPIKRGVSQDKIAKAKHSNRKSVAQMSASLFPVDEFLYDAPKEV
jgi:hypothetical protein